MKLTSDKVVRPALIAEMLDLKEVIIGQSMAVDSKDEFYDLWEDVAILFYKPESSLPNPNFGEPAFGYTIRPSYRPYLGC